MSPVSLVALALTLTFALALTFTSTLGCGTPKPTDASARNACTKGRAFVIVRHAEKEKVADDDPQKRDPPLSSLGRTRANAIGQMLAHVGVTRLIASQFKRTQETLAPLAQRVSLNVEVRPAEKTADLIDELRSASDGSVIVVATHSNVVPLVVRELSGGAKLQGVEGDALAEDDYERVIVITHPCGSTTPFVMDLRSLARGADAAPPGPAAPSPTENR